MTEPVVQDNLTAKQSDYAVFLPAISGFYATFIGKQRNEQYVDPGRFPQGLTDMEQLNWLNSQKALLADNFKSACIPLCNANTRLIRNKYFAKPKLNIKYFLSVKPNLLFNLAKNIILPNNERFRLSSKVYRSYPNRSSSAP